MVLTQKERQYAIIAGALVGILILYFGVTKYFTSRNALADEIERYNDELTNADRLAKDQIQMRKIEKDLVAGGLNTDSSDAKSRLQNNLSEWAQDSGVNLISGPNLINTVSQPVKNSPASKFHEIGFHLTGTGPLSTLAKLLWRIETATMPIRVSEVQISPRNGKEGLDDLQFTLTVSTLCNAFDSDRTLRSNGSTADARGGQ